MSKQNRPVAIPLVTVDPFFSIWSMADRLNEDHTRHWTGTANSMFGALIIDGTAFRFMGLTEPTTRLFAEGPTLRQTGVKVTPTSTVYTFTHPVCTLKVTFMTPLLLDAPEILSRPVSYITYEIKEKEAGHQIRFYLDASCQICGDPIPDSFYTCREEPGHAWMGAENQKLLARSGDDVRIEWGYLHMVHPAVKVIALEYRRAFFKKRASASRLAMDITAPVPEKKYPLLCVETEEKKGTVVLAYDDVKSIQYFGRNVDAYYKTVYGSFEKMLKKAVKETGRVRRLAAAFDAKLNAEAAKVSPEYAKIAALAYRQTIAAHKLVDVDGELMFFSKENFSNGCIATLDVTYPSIPLFLHYNPEFVRAMMRPLFAYARTPQWTYPFAPHDCGQYPLSNGQVYGLKDGVMREDKQMPVEECGNAILCVAAAFAVDGDRSLADQNRDLLSKWADYLCEYGYDPATQLCTDDFAGHLAHNCNLSLKAIVALAAYSRLYGEEKYAVKAREMAARWVKDAKNQNGKGWRLTFDTEGTWSMKYNIVWDRLLKLGLFDEKVSLEEIEVYTEKMNRYGVPLDSRADYTKLDWMAWTTVMADNKAYTEEVFRRIEAMIDESVDRVPITDWYDTKDARQIGFQARSVLGGFYINLLVDQFLNR